MVTNRPVAVNRPMPITMPIVWSLLDIFIITFLDHAAPSWDGNEVMICTTQQDYSANRYAKHYSLSLHSLRISRNTTIRGNPQKKATTRSPFFTGTAALSH